MKRIFCPKCDNQITFDETKYDKTKPIALVCTQCAAQFKIRIGKKPAQSFNNLEQTIEELDFTHGFILVIENGFGYKQELPLKLGDNVIGRRNKDTTGVDQPIITADPSMGRKHCVIRVRKNAQGEYKYSLRDFPSLTGTFLRNELVGKREQINIEYGAVVTIGATTFILCEPKEAEEA